MCNIHKDIKIGINRQVISVQLRLLHYSCAQEERRFKLTLSERKGCATPSWVSDSDSNIGQCT